MFLLLVILLHLSLYFPEKQNQCFAMCQTHQMHVPLLEKEKARQNQKMLLDKHVCFFILYFNFRQEHQSVLEPMKRKAFWMV